MLTGKLECKEGESSGDDSKKRTASPSLDDDGSDSTDSCRSRRKKPRVFFYVNSLPSMTILTRPGKSVFGFESKGRSRSVVITAYSSKFYDQPKTTIKKPAVQVSRCPASLQTALHEV